MSAVQSSLWGVRDRRHHPRDTVETPDTLFAALDAEFHFTLDACATADNHKCPEYFSPQDNALWQPWRGVVWCNPPYSDIPRWMRKAYESWQAGATVVLLLPVRSDMAWWHDHAMQGEVRFIRGRVRFKGLPYSAPFPSCVVIFRSPAEAGA